MQSVTLQRDNERSLSLSFVFKVAIFITICIVTWESMSDLVFFTTGNRVAFTRANSGTVVVNRHVDAALLIPPRNG